MDSQLDSVFLSLGFGILFATATTLILVPCLYLMIEDVHQLMGMARCRPQRLMPSVQ